MRGTVVGRLIRRSSWSRWRWGAALLALAVALIAYKERYLENALLGPFPIENKDLAAITSAGSPRRYYVVVHPNKVFRTGASRTRNARTEANYLILQVDGRLLFSDVAVEHEGNSYVGFLEEIPIDERNGVLAEIVNRAPELRDRLLPFKLNCWYGFQANGYVLIVFLAVLALWGLWLLLRATITLADPERHPIARKLARFGEPEQVAAAIEAEVEAGPIVEVDGTRMTPSWLLPKFGSWSTKPNGDPDAIFRIEDLVWVHQQVTYHGKTEMGHSLRVHDRYGVWREIPIRGGLEVGLLAALQSRAPWIITTYNPQLAALWRLNRAGLVQEVDQRRAAYEAGGPPPPGTS